MNKLTSARYANFPKIDALVKDFSWIVVVCSFIICISVYADTISVSVDGTQYAVDYTATWCHCI